MHHKLKTFFTSASITTASLISSLSLAGGPLVIEGADGQTAVSYLNPMVTVHIETGDLG